MGKRSDFKRRERDFYPTPYEAVGPLLPHLETKTHYHEPCSGTGELVKHLRQYEHRGYSTDIEAHYTVAEVCSVYSIAHCAGDCFITNPPWPAIGQHGEPTVSMALHLSNIAPTWFLLSADFMHNKYFAKLQTRCVKIVSVGRMKWIPDSDGPGKDNCAWYLFDANNIEQTKFYGWRTSVRARC